MVFFLITKKKIGKKILNLYRDLGVTFQMIFNSIINKKYKKKWTVKEKNYSILKEEDMPNLIYFMIGEQNLDYKLEVMLRVF